MDQPSNHENGIITKNVRYSLLIKRKIESFVVIFQNLGVAIFRHLRTSSHLCTNVKLVVLLIIAQVATVFDVLMCAGGTEVGVC